VPASWIRSDHECQETASPICDFVNEINGLAA
jgi:hypothetical protein